MLPASEARAMIDAINDREATVSVRVNNHKRGAPHDGLERVPWCEHGAYLKQRPQFTFDPLFHAGAYYVQDASSMFIYHVIKSLIHEPVKYLDLCAAPGGKTTAAMQALPVGSVMVANEIVPPRAHVLRENVIKWGNPACMVTCDSPKTIGNSLGGVFDVIAADVPCSGEGMFRKDDEAVRQWSPQLVKQCATRGQAILADVWNALKPGGLLIYSTCTYNREENEDIASFIINKLGASAVEVPVEPSWNIHPAIGSSLPCYRFMPHTTRGEGLFMCVLRKDSHSVHFNKARRDKIKNKNWSQPVPDEIKKWVTADNDFLLLEGKILALPRNIKAMIEIDATNLHVIKPLGTTVCEIKGKKIVPQHQLAMSTMLQAHLLEQCQVDYHTAISLLRGQALSINAPRGHVLITHQGTPLGFVNNLGNRANNLYPKQWRILSSHTPPSRDETVFLS